MLNPLFTILVEIIIFPYTWATPKAPRVPLLWPPTHSYPPQTSNCESDHISSPLGSREYLTPALLTLYAGSPSSLAAAPGAEFPLRPYIPAYTLHQALLASWSLLIQSPLFQMPLQSLHGSFQLSLQSLENLHLQEANPDTLCTMLSYFRNMSWRSFRKSILVCK